MEKLDPLIEGYLSYLLNVGRKTPRTVTDVRCTLRRAVAALERAHPRVFLWRLSLTDYLHWVEQERLGGAHTGLPCQVSVPHPRLTGVRLAQRAHRSQRTRRISTAGHSSAPRAAIPESGGSAAADQQLSTIKHARAT